MVSNQRRFITFHRKRSQGLCTPEAQIVCTGVRGVLRPSRAPVSVAIALVTHEAAALLHFVNLVLGPPVLGPLPHVTNHVLVTKP